jgi:hypothetical protein
MALMQLVDKPVVAEPAAEPAKKAKRAKKVASAETADAAPVEKKKPRARKKQAEG